MVSVVQDRELEGKPLPPAGEDSLGPGLGRALRLQHYRAGQKEEAAERGCTEIQT